MSQPQNPQNPQYPPAGQNYPGAGGPQGQPYPTQGGQPGYPPLGYPGQGGPGQPGQGGFRPAAAPPKGNKLVLGIVVAGLVAVVLIGILAMSLFGGRQAPEPNATPTVATSAPTASPSFQPTESPTAEPTVSTTPEPTDSPTTQPTDPSGAVEVGLGTSVVPVSGWKQSYRDELKNYTELSDGTALLVTQAFRVDSGVKGTQIVDSYVKQLAAKMTGVQKGTVKELDVGNEALSVGVGAVRGTKATSQGSIKLVYTVLISVRTDGLSVMATLITDSSTDPADYQEAYLEMASSLLNSQLAA